MFNLNNRDLDFKLHMSLAVFFFYYNKNIMCKHDLEDFRLLSRQISTHLWFLIWMFL